MDLATALKAHVIHIHTYALPQANYYHECENLEELTLVKELHV